jgi:hypothetical protein
MENYTLGKWKITGNGLTGCIEHAYFELDPIFLHKWQLGTPFGTQPITAGGSFDHA